MGAPNDVMGSHGVATLRVADLGEFTRIFSRRPAVFYRLYGSSDLQQAAPKRDGHGMRTIVGSQLVHEIFDMEINRGLGDR